MPPPDPAPDPSPRGRGRAAGDVAAASADFGGDDEQVRFSFGFSEKPKGEKKTIALVFLMAEAFVLAPSVFTTPRLPSKRRPREQDAVLLPPASQLEREVQRRGSSRRQRLLFFFRPTSRVPVSLVSDALSILETARPSPLPSRSTPFRRTPLPTSPTSAAWASARGLKASRRSRTPRQNWQWR